MRLSRRGLPLLFVVIAALHHGGAGAETEHTAASVKETRSSDALEDTSMGQRKLLQLFSGFGTYC